MKPLFAAVMLLLAGQARALDWRDSAEVGKVFVDAGVQGTFVLYDVDADRLIGHVYSFALNIDITQAADATTHIELGKASLKALGVL